MAGKRFTVNEVLGFIQADTDSGSEPEGDISDAGWPDSDNETDTDNNSETDSEKDSYFDPTPPPQRHTQLRGRGQSRTRGRARCKTSSEFSQGRVRSRGRARAQRGRGRSKNENPNPDQVYQSQWESLVNEEQYETWIKKFDENTGFTDKENFHDVQVTPIKIFETIIDDDFWNLLVKETNRYADKFLENNNLKSHSRFQAWRPVTISEMKAFIALLLAMGIVQKHELEAYWETNWLFDTPGFAKVMQRNRFELILSFLHFNDNNNHVPRGEDGHDRLFKVRPIIDLIIPKFKDLFVAQKELSLDEMTIAFKGRSFLKQYNPKKPDKWGYKAFVLSEAKSGYVLNWSLYAGKDDTRDPEESATYAIVKHLCVNHLDKGHIIFMDSYYTSVFLADFFISRDTGICGTVNINRKRMPLELRPASCPLSKGNDPVYYRNGKLLAVAWHDTKRLHMLSSVHSNSNVQKQIREKGTAGGYRDVLKPVAVDEYNKHMGGVDLSDQRLKTYKHPHRSRKWYMRIFTAILSMCVVNAHVIYKSLVAANDRIHLIKFQQLLCTSLLEGHAKRTIKQGRPVLGEKPLRLTEKHFMEMHPKGHRPDCVVCSDRHQRGGRRQSGYKCRDCDVTVCPVPCFERYHTLKDHKMCHLDM